MASSQFFHTDAGDDATATASSTATGYAVTNVQNAWLQVVHRFTSDTDENITFDFTSATALTAAVIDGHNITSGATITIRGSTDNFVASNVLVATATHQTGAIVVTWASVTYRYWRVRIEDPANPDTYIEIGRIFLGTYFQPTVTFDPGRSVSVEDPSIVLTSLNQVETSVTKPQRRREAGRFLILTSGELTNWRTFRDAVDQSQFFFVVWDPGDIANTGYYCRAVRLTLEQLFMDTWQASLDVLEAV